MRHDNSKAILADLVQALQSRLPGLIAIYRFGSRDTTAQRADSDIDLGLQADSPRDPVTLFNVTTELATVAGRDVDLVDMIRCSTGTFTRGLIQSTNGT